MRTAAILALVIGGSLVTTSMARAADETAQINSDFKPGEGSFFSNAYKAADWHFSAGIKAPFPASPRVQPVKRINITLPPDAKVSVDDSVTPPCGDGKISANENLNFPPDTIIARCPDSVLGNGTAELYLAQNNSESGTNLKDVVLVAFNGGKSGSGLPRIKVYGYSAATGAAIYMEGLSGGGNLELVIPRITFDSGVGAMTLDLPGRNHPTANRRGQDSGVVEAKCSEGRFATTASFTLGSRDSAGNPTSPDMIIVAPESSESCFGRPGSPGEPGNGYRLKVVKKGKGRGTVRSRPAGIKCGRKCNAKFPDRTHVKLTAKPDKKSVFAGWSGICGGKDVCRVTVTEAKEVTATFTPKRLRGPIGISIENGARSTDDRRVDIRVVWRAGSTRVRLANNRSFRGGRTFEVKRTIKWLLDPDTPGNRPAKVYARFDNSRMIFSDGIILDR